MNQLESLTLYPSKLKWILILLGSAAMLFMGVNLLGKDSDVEALIVQSTCVLGGLGILVSLLTLWPNSSWLKIGPDGIRARVLFRKAYYRWSDINRFGITTVQHGSGFSKSKTKFVSFWVKPENKMHSLSECYGEKPERLVAILENYWNRYG